MKKISITLLATCLIWPAFAKLPSPLCEGVNGPEFTEGDGSTAHPYLLCNPAQMTKLAEESDLWSKSFDMGRDISFKDLAFKPISTWSHAYSGHFNGQGYTLSDIVLDDWRISPSLSVFPRINHADIRNLNIDNFKITDWSGTSGTLAGTSFYSNIINVHATHIDSKAPDRSGGLIGHALHSTLFNVSVSGKLTMHFGTDASGGVIGLAENTTLRHVSASVWMENGSNDPFGTSDVGGIVGWLRDSDLSDAIAIGKISFVGFGEGPRFFGGICGSVTGSRVVRAVAVVDMNTVKAEHMGGALGAVSRSTIDNVYFDKEVTGFDFDAAGSGFNTDILKTAEFWHDRGFSESNWVINEGQYPALK